MNTLLKTGRLLYGLAIVAYGLQQIIIRDFRPQILPPFPAWAHYHAIFSIVTGLAMILFGLVAAGLVRTARLSPATLCTYLGCYFLILIITCQLPYLIFIFPHKLSHLGVWSDLLKELAFCGGSFIIAGTFYKKADVFATNTLFGISVNTLSTAGRFFFCTMLVLFGRSHFVYNEFIAQMVPGWLGMQKFWAYFGGVALIAAGVAIAFKIFLRPVALLLAIMLLLWFMLVHIPGVIANPGGQNGNAIVSAFDALLFCGTALVLSLKREQTANKRNNIYGVKSPQKNNAEI